jgi:hypothetical protein
MKLKKSVYFLSAAGIIGLAAFGVYNTANAVSDLKQTQNTEVILPVNSPAGEGLTGGCSPYGCAACPVCTVIQYQQNTVVNTEFTIKER